jgi:pimeloyl-ACP methyl ester carboxylesterase
MSKVTSKDGTQIAYEKTGKGPVVILVDGALMYRGFGSMPELANLLAPNFTVITYDRRGRGESGYSSSYSLQNEIDDLEALIQEAGGSASLYGISSGACLAMEAAIKLGNKVQKLAMYEPPYNSADNARQPWLDYRKQLNELLAAGRRGEAVVLFMNLVGTPADQIEGMRKAPMWPMFEAVAPTLAYDATAMGENRSVPVDRAAQVKSLTLVANGSILPFMYDTARALAQAIPHASQLTLEGQSHNVDLKVLAPVLVEFFTQEKQREHGAEFTEKR